MIDSSFYRIGAMYQRYLYLHKRSVSRVLEIVFWPVMDLVVWGFLTLYIQNISQGPLGKMIVFLLSATIFWDILYRSQQGVSISIIEDIWTHNIMNIFISPLRAWEWLMATFLYGMTKTLVITALLTILALAFYHFNMIQALGFYLIPFMFSLMLFGWAMGIFTSGLLIRWGHSVEALIWGVPFLVQPISAIFYPLNVLPSWLQPVAKSIPSTYIFEGMRSVIATGQMDWTNLALSYALNGLYFLLGAAFFAWMYESSRMTGRLGRLGLD